MLAEIIDQLCGEIIAHSYSRQPDQNAMRKIRLSIHKIVTDSVATSRGKKRTRWASIHKNANHYSNSRYQNEDISFRIHVARVYADLLALGYLEEIKSGVHSPRCQHPQCVTPIFVGQK